jgi:hypothetical protein
MEKMENTTIYIKTVTPKSPKGDFCNLQGFALPGMEAPSGVCLPVREAGGGKSTDKKWQR